MNSHVNVALEKPGNIPEAEGDLAAVAQAQLL